MEDLGVIIGFLALIGTPLASWVMINRKITKLETENLAMEKQFGGLELTSAKEFRRLEKDYKERFVTVERDLKEHEAHVDKNFSTLYAKMDDNTKDIITKLDAVKDEITNLKIKMGS